MLRHRTIIAAVLACALMQFLAATDARPSQAAQAGVPSLSQRVAAALTSELPESIAATPSMIQVLASGLHVAARARLRVVSVRPGYSPGTWLVRMDCNQRHDCLPFHVLLRTEAVPASHPSAGGVPGSAQGPSSSRAPIARNGDHVLLVESFPGMKLQMPAVCLQDGNLGDRIRVRSLGTHRVLLATVGGDNRAQVE